MPCYPAVWLCGCDWPHIRVLMSGDILSTDEESSGGESDDELGRDLESLLRGKKTTTQLTQEQEEAERLELKKLIMEDKVSEPVCLLTLVCRIAHTPLYRAPTSWTAVPTMREVCLWIVGCWCNH